MNCVAMQTLTRIQRNQYIEELSQLSLTLLLCILQGHNVVYCLHTCACVRLNSQVMFMHALLESRYTLLHISP